MVKAFGMFPDEFALRGYPQFPDSSDVHKPLYGVLKKQGLVKATQKQFALTPRGARIAQTLLEKAGTSLAKNGQPERLTRDVEAELERMLKSAAFQLFANEQPDRILDTDFYAFLGCTARTAKNDFIGRMKACETAVDTARKLSKPDATTARSLNRLYKHLKNAFKKEIDWKVNKHG